VWRRLRLALSGASRIAWWMLFIISTISYLFAVTHLWNSVAATWMLFTVAGILFKSDAARKALSQFQICKWLPSV
jgi:uncharacterized membrane protein HdeD (DUF308 family)